MFAEETRCTCELEITTLGCCSGCFPRALRMLLQCCAEVRGTLAKWFPTLSLCAPVLPGARAVENAAGAQEGRRGDGRPRLAAACHRRGLPVPGRDLGGGAGERTFALTAGQQAPLSRPLPGPQPASHRPRLRCNHLQRWAHRLPEKRRPGRRQGCRGQRWWSRPPGAGSPASVTWKHSIACLT